MKQHAGTQVAVVGAGIAGLAAAYKLQKTGITVTVFEQSNRPGGRMTTELVHGLAFDGGADFFSQNYHTLKQFAAEFGIDWIPTQKNSRHRVIRGGKPYYLNLGSLRDLARLQLISPWARVRLGLWGIRLMLLRRQFDMFDLSTVPGHFDFDNATDYVSKAAGPETAHYIIDSFVSSMQFHRAKQISTSALFALLQTMMGKENRFALCSSPKGIDQIPQALAKRLLVQYSRPVISVSQAAGGKIALRTTSGKPRIFDAVVIAAPAPVASKLLPKQFGGQKLLRSVRYACTLVVAFQVPANLFSDRTHLNYVPFVESKIIGGYTNEGAKLGSRLHHGKTLLNVYLQEESAKKMMDWPDEKVFSVTLKELKRLCPEVAGSRAVTPLTIARWPLAMPKFDHGYISRAREFLASHQGKNRIYFAGDYLNAPWTEGAARSGQRAADALIKKLR